MPLYRQADAASLATRSLGTRRHDTRTSIAALILDTERKAAAARRASIAANANGADPRYTPFVEGRYKLIR